MVGLNMAEMVAGAEKCHDFPKAIENSDSDVLMS